MNKNKYIFVLFIIISIWNCRKEDNPKNLPSGATEMTASPQRSGNAAKGYEYLIQGDYLNSGIPLSTFRIINPTTTEDLGRSGDNKGLLYNYTASTAANGVKVVAQNCLTCHATKIDDKIILGLGNNLNNSSEDLTGSLNNAEFAIKIQYGGINSNEWKAYESFGKAARAIAPAVVTNTIGANPADKIFAVLAGYRDGNDLRWLDKSQSPLPNDVIPTDVPAWWLMKKKHVLYYNGLGQGDFARLMMASSLLTMKDSSDARRIDKRFADVVAYINTLNAPKYPYATKATLVAQGKTVFEKKCAQCHGTYNTTPTYPNLLIDYKSVGTDPQLAQLYENFPYYHTWYNNSWFAKGPHAAHLLPQKGYIAPPLDGIWATAPYFHNGSVPSLEDVLNSAQRPKIWQRNSDANNDFDEAKVGWRYEVVDTKKDIFTYDTNQKGYGNQGHTYGDNLTPDERKAVVEYLKTL